MWTIDIMGWRAAMDGTSQVAKNHGSRVSETDLGWEKDQYVSL